MAAQRSKHDTPSAPQEGGEESFENLLARLEEIVGQLEAGERPLEESLTLYEQGVATLKRCHVILDGADKRIRRLLQNSAGEPVLQEVEQGSKRGKRGAAPPASITPRQVSAQDSGQDFDAAIDGGESPAEEIENSGKQEVDAEPSRPQNSPSSISKPKAKTTHPSQGGKAGGSLFGSAQ